MKVAAARYMQVVRRKLSGTLGAGLVIVVVGALGTWLLLDTHAATPTASFEAENGTIASSASVVNNSSASGGKAIQFGSVAPPPDDNPTEPTDPKKPTDASTGPRIATTTMAGGTLSGSYSGKHFTSGVTANGPLTLTDCIIDGNVTIHDGPVVIDHCDINGWFGVVTDNTDPNKKIATVKFTKITGPTNGDTMRIGPYYAGWGNNSVYVNTLMEDSIIYSPYNHFGYGDHFDLLQFGGGRNSTFNRIVMKYADYPFHSDNTNFVNNGTKNINVVFNDLWIEGGPVGYVLGGPMTVNTCVIDRSTAYYDYVYPSPGTVLNNCVDDTGAPISGT